MKAIFCEALKLRNLLSTAVIPREGVERMIDPGGFIISAGTVIPREGVESRSGLASIKSRNLSNM